MKILLTLSNQRGVLDQQTIDVKDSDDVEIAASIHEALQAWGLAPGDTIEITSLED